MRAILDAIYWKLHTSFLRNQRDESVRFLAMLEDEMSKGSSTLVSEIGPVQMSRFRKIKGKIKRGEFGRLYGEGSSVDDLSLSPTSGERSGPERDFCRSLLHESDKFLAALDFEFWSDIVPEVEMDPYGRCDFVIREGRKIGLVEVKMGKAPTSVVSQIDKYRLSTELGMCIGSYDEVLAYVIAESFQPYVASELSRLDVQMLEHRGTTGSLRKVGRNTGP